MKPVRGIGYRTCADGLRDLIMAIFADGKPTYVGTVELGIRTAPDLLKRLELMKTAAPGGFASVVAS